MESTAPGTPATPTMEEYAELVEQLQRQAGSTVKPGLNNAIARGDEFWTSAQAATNPATALQLAGQAVQCYLAPLILREGRVFVPPGPITLEDAPIDVGGFLIDANEVTVEQYQKFVASEHPRWSLPEEFKNRESELARHPISNVTFVDAQAYAAWVRGELPTEAQWARAAYGDSPGSAYPWEGEPEPGDCNVLFDPGVPNWPAPVGNFTSDLSDFGCFDLVGNVSEWTRSTVPALGPGAEPGFQSVMVIRGGNASEAPRPWNSRSTAVYEQKFLTLGFRTVVNIPSDPAGARAILAGEWEPGR